MRTIRRILSLCLFFAVLDMTGNAQGIKYRVLTEPCITNIRSDGKVVYALQPIDTYKRRLAIVRSDDGMRSYRVVSFANCREMSTSDSTTRWSSINGLAVTDSGYLYIESPIITWNFNTIFRGLLVAEQPGLIKRQPIFISPITTVFCVNSSGWILLGGRSDVPDPLRYTTNYGAEWNTVSITSGLKSRSCCLVGTIAVGVDDTKNGDFISVSRDTLQSFSSLPVPFSTLSVSHLVSSTAGTIVAVVSESNRDRIYFTNDTASSWTRLDIADQLDWIESACFVDDTLLIHPRLECTTSDVQIRKEMIPEQPWVHNSVLTLREADIPRGANTIMIYGLLGQLVSKVDIAGIENKSGFLRIPLVEPMPPVIVVQVPGQTGWLIQTLQ